MRRYVKRQLLDMMGSLEKAERPLESLCKESGRADHLSRLLEDMQECGIAIGKAIEETEEEGTESVRLLEQYCELLWNCLQAAYGAAKTEIYRELQRLRKKIQYTIKEEFNEVYDICFFPYKASMWDSMESVYKALEARDDCRCRIIPIPYYERKPDGSFGKEYYEGELYPDELPVFHYEDFKLEEERPDVAVFHNPYDDANYVTSVHPDYYSRNMKRYAGMLVYIPYFAIDGDLPVSFCKNPGSLLADRIIVQSESARRIYIRAMEEWFKESGNSGLISHRDLEKKILAIGSPKADKTVTAKREDYALLKEWEQLIKGKRAVLYNTGVSGILQGNEQELKKIEDTINVFSEKEDVVLWWRPHPLSESTCSSMRPRLLEHYQRLVRRYQEEKRGIFDDTADLHRAIAWTDMYYGDSSSLTALYGLTGKPVVMQNKYVLRDEREQDDSVSFSDCAAENSQLWFSAMSFNGLFSVNLDSGVTEYLGRIPEEAIMSANLYTRIIKDGETLWLIPGRAEELARFDLETGRFTKYSLPEKIRTGDIKFRSAHLKDGKLYMVPSEQPYLVVFDVEKETMTAEDFWKRNIEKKNDIQLSAPYSYENSVLEKDSLWFPVHKTNFIVEYAIKSGRFTIHTVPEKNGGYSFLASSGKDFYLASRNGKGELFRWIPGKRTELVASCPNYFPGAACVNLIADRNYIYMIPSVGKGIVRVNTDSGEIKFLESGNRASRQLYTLKVLENGVKILPVNEGRCHSQICLLNAHDSLERMLFCNTSESVLGGNENPFEQIIGENSSVYSSGYLIWESKEINLEKLISWPEKVVSAGQRTAYEKYFVNSDGTCGEKVAQIIAEEMKK